MCFFVGLFTALAQTPANLTFSGNAVLTSGNGFAMSGTGTITGLGSAVLSGAGTIDNAVLSGQKSGPILGSFTLVFQSGDVLVGNFSIPSGVLVVARARSLVGNALNGALSDAAGGDERLRCRSANAGTFLANHQ
jgi:hypothetical protein